MPRQWRPGGSEPDPAPGPPRGLKVLVVDPDRDTADLLALLLGLWGHQSRTASAGPEALELARSYRPDVVIAEVRLPGRDGWELARALRQEHAAALLVAHTGLGGDADRARSREAGFHHHLVKPDTVPALHDLLVRAAARKAAGA